MQIKKIDVDKILAIFLIGHLIIWTLIPAISNNNLPLDTIEALAWGSNLDWGYNKHPPLSAWAVEIFYQLFQNQDWAYYFLSQIFVILSFFIVWKISEDFFKKKLYRLFSVLLLEGIYFYNYTTPEFNVYVCQLPFKALLVYFCWKSLKNNKIINWIMFGLFASLGFLSHYTFLYLILALAIYFFIDITEKKKFNLNYLIPLIVFLILIFPHIIWLNENNYITLTYAFHRTGQEEWNFLNHILHPTKLLFKQIGILIPFFIMILLLIPKFKKKFFFKDKKLFFLVVVNILPILLILLTSLVMGIKIRTMWMSTFYLFFGILFIYAFQEKIKLKKIKHFFFVFLLFFILSPITYYIVSVSQTDKRTDYKGKEISNLVNKEWNYILKNNNSITNKKIEIIGWDEWYAGNLSYYLGGTKRPKVLMKDFTKAIAFKKENNFVLITKDLTANKVCSLTNQQTTKYLTHKKNIIDHNVCFLIFKTYK